MRISILNLQSTRLDISEKKRAEIQFSLEGLEKEDNLTLDLYPVENPAHPERHTGYWVFSSLEDGIFRLGVDLNKINEKSIKLERENIELPLRSFWVHSGKFVEPLIDFQIVVRRKNKIIKMVHLLLTLKSPKELERFYQREGGGEYKIDTLNFAFHKRRMKVLNRLFKKYIKKRNKVLDAGSGAGIFKELKTPFVRQVFCLDLHFKPLPAQGKDNFFHILGNAEAPPFKEKMFDILYSGEIVEHLLNPGSTLTKWRDLLKDDGYLIVTTPNLKRLINRARRYELPLSKEHVNEMSLKEAVELLNKAGFTIIKKRGIYLELFLTWWRKDNVVDLFQTRFNRKWAFPIIRFLMALGYYFPSFALDMVIVAKKAF